MPKRKKEEHKKSPKKSEKKNLSTILVVLGIIVVAGIIILFKVLNTGSEVSSNLAKCIGEKAQVYVQAGCSHCADQEAMFGSNWQYINSTDCATKEYAQLCYNLKIPGTPTWIINGTQYPGVQSIETLANLTGC
jgi:hypothetical protein